MRSPTTRKCEEQVESTELVNVGHQILMLLSFIVYRIFFAASMKALILPTS